MRSPVIFVAHGAPIASPRGAAPGAAAGEDSYASALGALHSVTPRPSAVVVVSSSWRARPGGVTGAKQPATMHDHPAGGDGLGEVRYPAPGLPMLAQRLADRLAVPVDRERGLDHGVWMPLRHIFPRADVPVVQVALPAGAAPAALIDLGRRLAYLREENVWIIGSGAIVHNLGRPQAASDGDSLPPEWARAFDAWVGERITSLDLTTLIEYRRQGPHAGVAMPAPEYLDPVFVVLGAALPGDRVETFYEGFEHGTISLRSFLLSDAPLRRSSSANPWLTA